MKVASCHFYRAEIESYKSKEALRENTFHRERVHSQLTPDWVLNLFLAFAVAVENTKNSDIN